MSWSRAIAESIILMWILVASFAALWLLAGCSTCPKGTREYCSTPAGPLGGCHAKLECLPKAQP